MSRQAAVKGGIPATASEGRLSGNSAIQSMSGMPASNRETCRDTGFLQRLRLRNVHKP
jgi:hypothetical protein